MSATSLMGRIYRIAILRGGGLVLTLGLTALQAAAFGTGPTGDAFHLVRQSLASLTSALEAGVQKLLVPHFVQTGGGAQARRKLVIWMGGGALVFALLLMLFAPPLIGVLATGFDPARQSLATDIFRILVLGLPVYVLTAIVASQAFADRRFSLATFAGLLPRVFGVTGFVVVGYGITGQGLASWLLGGMVAMLILVWWGQRGISSEPLVASDTFQPASGSRVLAIVIVIVSQVLLTWATGLLASLGPAGSAAILFLSLRLINAAPALANSAITTVYYTEFARATDGEGPNRAEHVANSLATSVFFILPFCGLLIVVADPVVSLLLERGNFTAMDRVRMATLIPVIAPVLLFNALYATLQNSVMADTQGPLLRIISITAAIALFLRIGVGLALIPTLGLVGLAVALLLSAAGQAFAILALTWSMHSAVFSARLLARIAAIVLSGLIATSLSFYADLYGAPIALSVTVFAAAYLAVGYALRIPEVNALLSRARRSK